MKSAIEENHKIMNALFDKIKQHDEVIKKMSENIEKKERFTNTKAAFKLSMNKQIDGKTMIAIGMYLVFKFWSAKNPRLLDPVWGIAIDVGIWVICLLFNIDNPSVAKFFRQIGEFLTDLTLDDETAMKEMRIWYAALGQKYMKIFDSLGKKISPGVIEIEKID